MQAWPHFPDEETEDAWPRSPCRGQVLSTLPPRRFVPLYGGLGGWRRPGVGVAVGAWPQGLPFPKGLSLGVLGSPSLMSAPSLPVVEILLPAICIICRIF